MSMTRKHGGPRHTIGRLCQPQMRGDVPSPGIGEAKAAINEARVALEDARHALAYRSGNVNCADVITLVAYAQVAVETALTAAREVRRAHDEDVKEAIEEIEALGVMGGPDALRKTAVEVLSHHDEHHAREDALRAALSELCDNVRDTSDDRASYVRARALLKGGHGGR